MMVEVAKRGLPVEPNAVEVAEADRQVDLRAEMDRPVEADRLVADRLVAEDTAVTMEATTTAITVTPSSGLRWPFKANRAWTTRSTAKYLKLALSVATKSCLATTATLRQNAKCFTSAKQVSALNRNDFFPESLSRKFIYFSFSNCATDGRMDSFLCPNGTIFAQNYFVCVWWHGKWLFLGKRKSFLK